MPGQRARAALRRPLLSWFRAERRDLPWRRTRDPYAIWISEAMLQQTRVETVVPYYERFLARLPDVQALAAAGEGELLALWSGLGYYSRARALGAAARVVVGELGGRFPVTRAGWLALPGIGPYTAGAVLSIALGRSEALVDGNVQRVLARLFALEAPQGSRALTEVCWELARALVPPEGGGEDPGEWNQALMELGARVCTARAPRCAECPLRRACRARAAGRVDELPRLRARRTPLAVRLEMLVVRQRGRILLVRRPEVGRMAGLYELPTRELIDAGAPRLWPAAHRTGLARVAGEALAGLAHAITHHRIRAELVPGRGARARPAELWASLEEARALALTGLTRKALLALERAGEAYASASSARSGSSSRSKRRQRPTERASTGARTRQALAVETAPAAGRARHAGSQGRSVKATRAREPASTSATRAS